MRVLSSGIDVELYATLDAVVYDFFSCCGIEWGVNSFLTIDLALGVCVVCGVDHLV